MTRSGGLRRAAGRSRMRQRALALAAAAVLFPIAAAATVLEVAMRRGGTVYVEARRG